MSRRENLIQPIAIANHLYELRKARHLTQSEMAERMGISTRAYSDWETAHALPSYERLARLARFFGVTTDDILCLETGDVSFL